MAMVGDSRVSSFDRIVGAAGVVSLLWAVSFLLAAAEAQALTQPDGTVIPTDTEVELELAALGDTVMPLTDAAVTPETFRPECNLTFTVLQRFTDYRNSFGWYNVTGTPPEPSELYEFIYCDDPPNPWETTDANDTTRELSIAGDPRYLGGEIGFFQAVAAHSGTCANVTDPTTVGTVMYSQRDLNPEVNDPPFIHLLIMDSKISGNTFYFAWEDLLAGGDNDFSDLVLRVEGITCAGGGEPCDSGALGVCAGGVTQCVNGEISCVPREVGSDETCNALDDDCDGEVDDGDLCEEDWLCDRGVCVPGCGSGEFECEIGEVCREDYCVERACVDVACETGQICRGGVCLDPCDGVVCPYGQECRAGRCVDPCGNVVCGDNQACIDGACITSCACSGCPEGNACDLTLLRCIEDACAAVSCDLGTHCEAGSCVDNCLGALCPPGQMCELGECVGEIDSPVGGAGGMAGTGGGLSVGGTLSIGGSFTVGIGGMPDGGTPAAGGTAGSTDVGSDSGRDVATGCGCRATPTNGFGFGLLLLLGPLAVRRLRRRAA